jgi:hypothetical protein
VGLSNSIRRRLSEIARLRARDLPLAAASTVLLAIAVCSLKAHGFQAAGRRVTKASALLVRNSRNGDAQAVAARVVSLVEFSARVLPGGAGCLARSLVISAVLQRVNIEARLRVGVQAGVAGFGAHAWVECFGAPINDTPEVVASFVAFEAPVSRAVIVAMR